VWHYKAYNDTNPAPRRRIRNIVYQSILMDGVIPVVPMKDVVDPPKRKNQKNSNNKRKRKIDEND